MFFLTKRFSRTFANIDSRTFSSLPSTAQASVSAEFFLHHHLCHLQSRWINSWYFSAILIQKDR